MASSAHTGVQGALWTLTAGALSLQLHHKVVPVLQHRQDGRPGRPAGGWEAAHGGRRGRGVGGQGCWRRVQQRACQLAGGAAGPRHRPKAARAPLGAAPPPPSHPRARLPATHGPLVTMVAGADCGPQPSPLPAWARKVYSMPAWKERKVNTSCGGGVGQVARRRRV